MMNARTRSAAMICIGLAATFVAPRSMGAEPDANAPPPGVPQDWWRTVQRDIAASEYRIRAEGAPEGASYHAPNRAQGFRTLFTPGGFRSIPRVSHASEAPAWEWGLALAAWGVDGHMTEPGPAELRINGDRLEYHRPGLIEWYTNDARGLEQGFIVNDRPVGGDQLRVEMAVSGTVAAQMTGGGAAVDFLAPGGSRAIRFDHLHTVDAHGRELPCRFELCDESHSGSQRLSIVVDDAEAAYPVTIDPLATSPSWTAESNQVGAEFGASVAPAGDVNGDGFGDVIVGAPMYDPLFAGQNIGRVFVYHGSAAGLGLTHAWFANGVQEDEAFGGSVSTAGDVNGDGYSDVIIGADLYGDLDGFLDEGRAYVYYGSATGLAGAPWIAEGGIDEVRLGISVATAGDVNGDGYSDVIIGAPGYSNGQFEEGRALVYHGSASGLGATPAWTGEENQAGAFYGGRVATAGDVNGDGFSDVIVAAYAHDNGQLDEGRVYAYHGSAAGLSATPAWTVESNQAQSLFGGSVAPAGDVNGDGYSDVIISADRFDAGQTDEGRAFVYHGSSAGLGATAAWTAEGNLASIFFGSTVATAGDVNGDGYSDVIIGVEGYDNVELNEGRSLVYYGSSTGLAAAAAWTIESNQSQAFLGVVATAGDVNGDGYSDVIVGAASYDAGQSNEGRAFVYLGAPSGLATTEGWAVESDLAQSTFGSSVSAAGDVNSDGYADVIVGAPFYSNGQTEEGRAYVFHGSSSGLATTPAWTAESNAGFSHFGWVVSAAGDVNGDGFGDVIIGAPDYDGFNFMNGRAYVYHGSTTGLGAAPAWTFTGLNLQEFVGWSLGSAGDVNGDGYGDVIIGSPGYINGQVGEGAARVFHGGTGGLSLLPAWTVEGGAETLAMGDHVASAGDVNGDGFSDVVVRRNFGSVGQVNCYHGSSSGLATTPAWSAQGTQNSGAFGAAISTAGDVNGDGYSDVIIGAPYEDNGQSNEGRVYVYLGSPTGLETMAAWIGEGNESALAYGLCVATAGDVNGDGYSDIVIGTPGFSDTAGAFVYHGSASGLGAAAQWTGGTGLSSAFGSSVAGAGDVNGDGYADVIIGDRAHSGGQFYEGRAYLYYGNGGPGRLIAPRQLRTDDTTFIAPLGRSNSETQFRIRARINSIFGRTGVAMQHEVKPLGTLFDGTGLGDGGFSDTGSDGVNIFARLVSGLTPGTLYHWRVRARYDTTSVPFQEYSHWIHNPRNGWNETDLRTAGTPPVTGACCYAEGDCEDALTLTQCLKQGGEYQGDASLCSGVVCPTPCPADCAGGDGMVNVSDLLTLLAQWGGPGSCDISPLPPNNDGVVSVGDLLQILALWGACP